MYQEGGVPVLKCGAVRFRDGEGRKDFLHLWCSFS